MDRTPLKTCPICDGVPKVSEVSFPMPFLNETVSMVTIRCCFAKVEKMKNIPKETMFVREDIYDTLYEKAAKVWNARGDDALNIGLRENGGAE